MNVAKHLGNRVADPNWRGDRYIRIVGPVPPPVETVTSVVNAPSFGDRYRIERELGRGGMATVYLCTDSKFERPVAIKLLHPDLAAAVGAERFHREIRIATGLTHPNILPAYDSGEANGSLYYVMPFVQGESLRDRITREKQLPVDDTVRIITEVAHALHFAHESGIVHRDIKPENILLESGVAVVADFGIARAITNAADVEALTQTGVSIGTPTYMSPEQAVGEKGVDGRSDQYSLACVMYEMLAGHPPFQASTLQGIIMKHVGEPVPLVTTVRPSVPDELEDVMLRALEKVPADRFPSIGDFAAALNTVVAQTGTWARRTSTKTAQLRATRRHSAIALSPGGMARRWLAIGIGGVAVAGGATAVVLYANSAGTQPTVDALAREIAVTYLDVERGAEGLRHIADGLTEALIEKLDRVPVLNVRSRDGVIPFRGTTIGADSVARALAVGYVVRGSVESRRDGGRVTVRLMDASGVTVEREDFDFNAASALLVADSLATQIAAYLRERIGPEVALRELRTGTNNTDAWTFALRADRRIADGDSMVVAGAMAPALLAVTEADSLLQLAERADREWTRPIVLRATAALTHARALLGDRNRMPAIIDTGIAHADRAILKDPLDPDAHEIRGRLLHFEFARGLIADPAAHQRTLDAAEAALRRATQINPFQAGAWDELSALYYRKEDLGAVILAAERAYNADAYFRNARSILNRLFYAHYSNEAWNEAMKWLDAFRHRFPNDRLGVEGRLYMYRSPYGGVNIDSAWLYQKQYVELTPEAGREFARRKAEIHVAGALARAGLADSARQVLLRARTIDRSMDPRRDLAAIEAAVRVMLGDKQIAVDLLKEYVVVNPDHSDFSSRTIWWWRDLQNYPPFQAFIAGR
jgi:TolB-like protein/tetratricopeptide (TPR) repeat protein